MNRWQEVDDQTVLEMTVKMYRDPFVPTNSIISEFELLEMDHYAYKYFENEQLMYRIMDTNWDQYMEERGDVDNLVNVKIPTQRDVGKTIL